MIDSARLRKELERVLADQSGAVRDLAQQVADETWKRVESGTPAAKAVSEAMDAAGVDAALQARLGRDVVQSLCAGAGILPQITAAGLLDPLAAKALTLSWDPSGMPLSSRLHSAQTKQEVAHAISTAIARKEASWTTARKIYDGYGFGGALKAQNLSDLPKELQRLVDISGKALRPEDVPGFMESVKEVRKYAQSLRTAPLRAAYTQLVDKLDKGLTRGLQNAVRVAAEEKTRYFAERILRTESARAWGEGFFDQVDQDSDATGVHWETSSAHKLFDVCDFHARADLFGMGPGVYPKEHRPSYPAHPHCLCAMSAWYRGTARPQVQEGGKRALDGMSESERARLLGVKGAKAFEGGGQWRGSLRNWTEPKSGKMSQGAKTILEEARSVAQPVPYANKATIKDAEAWARQNNLADVVSYNGLHIEAANRINETVHKHLQEFPGLRAGLQFIGSAQEQNREAKKRLAQKGIHPRTISMMIKPVGPHTMAFSVDKKHKQYEGVHGVGFNEKFFGSNYEDFAPHIMKTCGAGKFHPPGKDPVTDAVAHELGHQLDALYGLRTDATVLELWNEAKSAGIRESISGYAMQKGITEGIAEGWSEAFATDSPRSFASGLRDRILQIRKESP